MIKSDGASSATPYEPLWGWQRPECRGRHAVELFMDDLHRILQAYAANRLAPDNALEHAQNQVDTLLVRYDEVTGSPNAFSGQHVELKEGTDRNGVVHIVPIFSADLKKAMVQILAH